MLDRDTHPDAHAVQIAAFRRLGLRGRVQAAVTMSEDARQIALEGVRRRHPELTEREAQLVLFKHIWGGELFERVWGREVRKL